MSGDARGMKEEGKDGRDGRSGGRRKKELDYFRTTSLSSSSSSFPCLKKDVTRSRGKERKEKITDKRYRQIK